MMRRESIASSWHYHYGATPEGFSEASRLFGAQSDTGQTKDSTWPTQNQNWETSRN
jgi:hypothetical protein